MSVKFKLKAFFPTKYLNIFVSYTSKNAYPFTYFQSDQTINNFCLKIVSFEFLRNGENIEFNELECYSISFGISYRCDIKLSYS